MSKRVLASIVVTILVIICVSTTIYAASIIMGLTTSVATAKRGEQITITLSSSDIDMTNGLFGVSGTIVFDESVFEPITAESFTLGSGWATPSYNESGTNKGNFEIMRISSPTTQNTDIFKIPLKVKSNATTGSTTITIENIRASNSELQGSPNDEEITVPDKLVTINITSDSLGNIPVVNNTVNNSLGLNTNTSTPTNTSIPKAGVENYVLPIIVILAITVTISYIKYKKAI